MDTRSWKSWGRQVQWWLNDLDVQLAVAVLVLAVCLLLLVVKSFGQTVQLDGVVNAPDTSGFTGKILLTLRKPTPDSCNSGQIVPMVVGTLTVANGTVTNHPSLTPSGCLNPVQPYLVTVLDSQNAYLFQVRWWVASSGGAFFNPANGNSYLFPSGMSVHGQPSLDGAITMDAGGDYREASVSASFTAGQTQSLTVTWPRPFNALTYSVGCTTQATGGFSSGVSILSFSNQTAGGITASVKSVNAATVTLFCNARLN